MIKFYRFHIYHSKKTCVDQKLLSELIPNIASYMFDHEVAESFETLSFDKNGRAMFFDLIIDRKHYKKSFYRAFIREIRDVLKNSFCNGYELKRAYVQEL